MLRAFTRTLCMAMLLAGPASLRSLHALSHPHHAEQFARGAPIEKTAKFTGNSGTFSTTPDHDDGDREDASGPSQGHCGICDELAAATNDAGLDIEPIAAAPADFPTDIVRPSQPCSIESPRVALANPPPSI